MDLYGWFELTFYSPDGYLGIFGNNAVPVDRRLADGNIGQEMGLRVSGSDGIPLGFFDSIWRGQGHPTVSNKLRLEIISHRENTSAFELFWRAGNGTLEFYGVGNLLDGNRLIGWYDMRDTDPLQP